MLVKDVIKFGYGGAKDSLLKTLLFDYILFERNVCLSLVNNRDIIYLLKINPVFFDKLHQRFNIWALIQKCWNVALSGDFNMLWVIIHKNRFLWLTSNNLKHNIEKFRHCLIHVVIKGVNLW